MRESSGPGLEERMTGLMVASLPVAESGARDYSQGIVRALVRNDLERRAHNLQASLNRTDETSPEYREAFRELMEIEQRRRAYSDVTT